MKKLYIPVVVTAVLTAVLIMIYALSFKTVRLGKEVSGTVVYCYDAVSFEEPLTAGQADMAARLLDGKRLPPVTLSGTPSCGFSQDVSIILNGRRFLMACDTCGILQDAETGRYLTVTDGERQALEALFTAHGGSFPCI